MKGRFVRTKEDHVCERCKKTLPKGTTAFSALRNYCKEGKHNPYPGEYYSRKYYCPDCVRRNYEWKPNSENSYGEETWEFVGKGKKMTKEEWEKFWTRYLF